MEGRRGPNFKHGSLTWLEVPVHGTMRVQPVVHRIVISF